METPKEVRLWIAKFEDAVIPSSTSSRTSDERDDEFCIYSAPPHLVKEDEDIRRSLQPIVVTVGPVHYNSSKHVFWEGNRLKEEALRKISAEDASVKWDDVFSDLVQKIAEKEEKIKACYANRNAIPCYLTGNAFGWMIVADCCFLLQVFALISKKTAVDRSKWPRLATFVGDINEGRLQDWVLDLIKIDNQIPLWVTADIADFLPGWASTGKEISERVAMGTVLSTISPLHIKFDLEADETEQWRKSYGNRQSNLLHLLRLFAAGYEEKRGTPAPKPSEEDVNKPRDIRKECIECFEDFVSPDFLFPSRSRIATCLMNSLLLTAAIILYVILCSLLFAVAVPLSLAMFLLMLPFLLIACIWPRPYEEENAELKLRAGCLNASVSFEPTFEGIVRTRLERKTLTLPLMESVGEKARVTLSNMMALERSNPRLRKIVCNYVFLMSQLIVTSEDIEELENSGVISVAKGKDRKWISGMWKSLRRLAQNTSETDAPDSVSVTRAALLALPPPSRQNLIWPALRFWTRDLRRRYGANPWVALSATAAIVLLFMTGAQVVCLFVQCSPKKSKDT